MNWWPLIRILPQKTNLHFVKYAKPAAVVSIILCVASIVGCPAGTVMSRLHRGRSRLRQALGDYAREQGIGTPNGSGEGSPAHSKFAEEGATQ